MASVTKVCTTCCRLKPLSEFRQQSKTKDGLKYTCIACDDKKARKRYAAKKAEIIKKVKDWQAKNLTKVKEYKLRHQASKQTNINPSL
jgi:hypothetical protein